MKKSSYVFVALLTVAIIGISLALSTTVPTAPIITSKDSKTPSAQLDVHAPYTINAKWELPKELKEVSGIAWLNPNTFACIQDEDGILFIYDLDARSITNRIEFGEPGDYEGIAVVNKNAYVLRSDGTIFEITDFESNKMKVTLFKTGFSIKNNMESLTYNKNTKRLITIPKDQGLENEKFKSLYEIDLETKKREAKPLLKIDMNAEAFKDFRKKKVKKTFNPSDVAIHPKTNDLYVLDGKHPKLAIFTSEGIIKKVIELNKDTFPQPEGIAFAPDGTLYISNEANKGPATLLEVSIK